jgi:DNA-binding NtrC family response regulator
MWSPIPKFFAIVSRLAWRETPIARRRSSQNENALWHSHRITIVALGVGDQDHEFLTRVSERHQWNLHFTDTCEEAWEALNQLKAPIILCDRDLPGTQWRDVVRMMASSSHGACAVLVSRVVDDYLWKEVIRGGGYDVLSKPLKEDDFVRSVRLAWSYWNSTIMKRSPLPLKHYL